MQNKFCNYCKAEVFEPYSCLSPAVFKGQYQIVVCPSCGIGFTTPMPQADIVHYAEAVRSLRKSDEAYFRKSAREVITVATRLYRGQYGVDASSLLDIGCGFGLLVSEAKQAGLKSRGIEPSVAMAEYASGMGLEIFRGSLFEFDDYRNFDLLHLESVLEHIEDVVGLLAFLKSEAKPQSLMIFGQALYDGLIPRVFKRFWYGWSPAEHYWHFSEAAFSRLLHANGFQIIKVERTCLVHPFYWGPKLKSLLFQNSKAILNVFARLLGRGDHGYFYVKPII